MTITSTGPATTSDPVAPSTSLIELVSDLRLIATVQPQLANPGRLPMAVTAAGTVFSDGTDVWMCADQDDSYPPGCGRDVFLEGVSVADLPGAVTPETDPSVGDVSWAEGIRVVGSYDGTTIEVTEPPTEADFGSRSYDFSMPCPPAEWASGVAAERAAVQAQGMEGYAIHWLAGRADTLVVAFAGDLGPRQAVLAEVAGAPVCAIRADSSQDDLIGALDAITEDIDAWKDDGVAIRTVGSGELGNRVDVLVVWADDGRP